MRSGQEQTAEPAVLPTFHTRWAPRPRGRAEHSAPNLTKQLSLRPHLHRGRELRVQKLLPKLGKGSEHQSEPVFHPMLCARRRPVRSQ